MFLSAAEDWDGFLDLRTEQAGRGSPVPPPEPAVGPDRAEAQLAPSRKIPLGILVLVDKTLWRLHRGNTGVSYLRQSNKARHQLTFTEECSFRRKA